MRWRWIQSQLQGDILISTMFNCLVICILNFACSHKKTLFSYLEPQGAGSEPIGERINTFINAYVIDTTESVEFGFKHEVCFHHSLHKINSTCLARHAWLCWHIVLRWILCFIARLHGNHCEERIRRSYEGREGWVWISLWTRIFYSSNFSAIKLLRHRCLKKLFAIVFTENADHFTRGDENKVDSEKRYSQWFCIQQSGSLAFDNGCALYSPYQIDPLDGTIPLVCYISLIWTLNKSFRPIFLRNSLSWSTVWPNCVIVLLSSSESL